MPEPSNAPIPETMEGLRRQNSAYRSLCASLEAQQAIQTAKGLEYHEAVTTLESEREANALLTERAERLEAAMADAIAVSDAAEKACPVNKAGSLQRKNAHCAAPWRTRHAGELRLPITGRCR